MLITFTFFYDVDETPQKIRYNFFPKISTPPDFALELPYIFHIMIRKMNDSL
jgi:hypothetical protein